jgi:hypothetical protein
MVKLLSLALMGTGLTFGVMGQIKKQFSVEDAGHCEKIDLHLKAKTGNCFIRPSQNSDLLNIYSNQELEEYGHSFSQEVKDQTCMVKLSLDQEGERGVGRKISYRVFGDNESAVLDKVWKVYLTEEKPYALDLDYGLGNANIDLSGLSISKLKIKTGSADVNVSYASGIENRVEMDTFFVKVDLGSVSVKQLNLSRAGVVLADVGFGNMMLDFSDTPLTNNLVKGSVGAGNLIIMLPDKETPILVKITDSWLCSVNLCRGLKKIGENTFANAAYKRDAKNSITFDLEVSMGKIIFKEKN